MTAQELVSAFETGTPPPGGFDHRRHVHMAWAYLRCLPLPEVLVRFPAALRRLARNAGAEEKYHETVTWAYVLLIRERMERTGPDADWERFQERNRDLLDWKDSILKRYYSRATLESPLARNVFVMPDRVPPR